MGLGCDEGGQGVDLGAQSVPKWGLDIADSNTVYCVEGIFATLYEDPYPK